MDLEQQFDLIKKGTVEVIPADLFKDRLSRSIKTGKPLTVKAGFDPSAPDLHLGHTVLLRKLKHFQQLGHNVVFLIGDFTGRIGDPSGQSQIRRRLSKEEISKNAKTYERQIFKILDRKKTKVVFNSRWLNRLRIDELLELMSRTTVAQMLAREDFKNRYQAGADISLLEFIYPLLQGYDSVILKADIEIGGTDQKFNLLMAREIQQAYGVRPQAIITMPLLVGTDGVKKMSKSYGNYIALDDTPGDMFGKVMSISDEPMYDYYELLTDEAASDIRNLVHSSALHPKQAKINLAKAVVSQIYSKEEAEDAAAEFDRVFKEKMNPGQMPEFILEKEETELIEVMLSSGLVSTRSDAKRLINQGAVKLNGKVVNDIKFKVPIAFAGKVLQVGKLRFVKLCKK